MHDNNTIMPRWIQFTNAQSEARIKYEGAQVNARMMQSSCDEMGVVVADFKEKRAQAEQAKAEVAAAQEKALKPFNALQPEVQKAIEANLKNGYAAYKQQKGGQALDEKAYMVAGKIAVGNDPKTVEKFQKAEEAIKYVIEKEQQANPSLDPAKVSDTVRKVAAENPAAVQNAYNEYKHRDDMQHAKADADAKETPLADRDKSAPITGTPEKVAAVGGTGKGAEQVLAQTNGDRGQTVPKEQATLLVQAQATQASHDRITSPTAGTGGPSQGTSAGVA